MEIIEPVYRVVVRIGDAVCKVGCGGEMILGYKIWVDTCICFWPDFGENDIL